MRGFLLLILVAAGLVGCSNGRSGCRFSSDCAANMHCVMSRCLVNQDGGDGTDGGSGGTDAGSDAGNDAASSMPDAFVPPVDAGHDAFVAPVDAGRDAGSDAGRDAGHDAAMSADAWSMPGTATLIFSEYVEGSSNNKALEIANVGTASVDLSACTVRLYANGAGAMTASYPLTGSLAAGAVITICHSSATGFDPATCTAMIGGGVMGFNGNDALVLDCAGIVDSIGQVGSDPGSAGWGTGSVTTTDATLRRACSVTSGDRVQSDAYDPATEWTSPGVDVFDGLGMRGCP